MMQDSTSYPRIKMTNHQLRIKYWNSLNGMEHEKRSTELTAMLALGGQN